MFAPLNLLTFITTHVMAPVDLPQQDDDETVDPTGSHTVKMPKDMTFSGVITSIKTFGMTFKSTSLEDRPAEVLIKFASHKQYEAVSTMTVENPIDIIVSPRLESQTKTLVFVLQSIVQN